MSVQFCLKLFKTKGTNVSWNIVINQLCRRLTSHLAKGYGAYQDVK